MSQLANEDQLADKALEAQLIARFRTATPRDTLLVTPVLESDPDYDPVGVEELTGTELREVQDMLSMRAQVQRVKGEGSNEGEARRVRSV